MRRKALGFVYQFHHLLPEFSAIESRLALDTTVVDLQFDGASDADRDRIAQLYRIGRILRHESSNGHISIQAEIPRRVLERFSVAGADVP